MRIALLMVAVLLLFSLGISCQRCDAGTDPGVLQQSMSDTLDLWREGRYEQLYEQLAHRGKVSKEQFVDRMRSSSIRPACCFQKLEEFRVLNEKKTEATVYARIGLEGVPTVSDAVTREFKLTHVEQVWRMQLADVLSISGATAKKRKHASRRKLIANQ